MNAQVRSDTATSDIVVSLCNVSKRYMQRQRSEQLVDAFRNLIRPEFKAVTALDNVSLTIGRGEIVAYAGANGAGKSTTVKLCSGLIAPDSGTVCVLGMNPVRDRVTFVAHIGVVFGHRTELWFDHPVSASFEWKRVVWDIPEATYRRALGALRESLGLDEFFNTVARELSLGQRMRADLALALVHEPEILFLDEPTLGLDVLARKTMLSYIRNLSREKCVTIMMTSHDMSDLEALAGRIVMLDHGKIAFDGGFEALRQQALDRRTLDIDTDSPNPPLLNGAVHTSSEGGRHVYQFDAGAVHISALLNEAAQQCVILDVQTQQVAIDDVIATLYTRWKDKTTDTRV